VAALLAEPTAYPISGVRTATFAPDDRLRGEWNLAVVGPHFAALLTGRRNPAATGVSDEVLVGLTYDRDVVLHAARSLLQRLTDAQDSAA
jgi:DICT domain-containing protein